MFLPWSTTKVGSFRSFVPSEKWNRPHERDQTTEKRSHLKHTTRSTNFVGHIKLFINKDWAQVDHSNYRKQKNPERFRWLLCRTLPVLGGSGGFVENGSRSKFLEPIEAVRNLPVLSETIRSEFVCKETIRKNDQGEVCLVDRFVFEQIGPTADRLILMSDQANLLRPNNHDRKQSYTTSSFACFFDPSDEQVHFSEKWRSGDLLMRSIRIQGPFSSTNQISRDSRPVADGNVLLRKTAAWVTPRDRREPQVGFPTKTLNRFAR